MKPAALQSLLGQAPKRDLWPTVFKELNEAKSHGSELGSESHPGVPSGSPQPWAGSNLVQDSDSLVRNLEPQSPTKPHPDF